MPGPIRGRRLHGYDGRPTRLALGCLLQLRDLGGFSIDGARTELVDLRTRLRHVLWIGGGTGAGKSSVAIALAERYGLERYNYDWHDSRDHAERTRADRHPHNATFLAMTLDERWLRHVPREMADEAIDIFGERFEMVIEDLLAMPEHTPVIADGFGLLPELVHPILESPRQAIFLLPTPELRVVALERRGWGSVEGTSDPVRARENRLARDALLTDHIRGSAAALGLVAGEVDGSRSLADIASAVARHFAPRMP